MRSKALVFLFYRIIKHLNSWSHSYETYYKIPEELIKNAKKGNCVSVVRTHGKYDDSLERR